MDTSPKDQPAITQFNAYSQRTDLYLPSFYKKLQTKQNESDVHPVEYPQLPHAGESEDLFNGQTKQEKNKCNIWESPENMVLNEERFSSDVAHPLCSFSAQSEITAADKVPVDNKITERPIEQEVSSVSNGHVEQTLISGLNHDPNKADVSWTEESHEIAYQEVPRISASRQMKSVIKRTKESPNVHPMSRDLSPRRKFGPAIYNKSPSQDRLIEELHGRFGIDKQETSKTPEDNWLTEGVIITSQPTKNVQATEQRIEKIIIPPDSPQLMRKTLSITTTSSPPGTMQPTRLVSKSTSPALPPPPTSSSTSVTSLNPPPAPPLPPILASLQNMPPSSALPPQPPPSWKRYSDDYQDLSRAVFPQEESRNPYEAEPFVPLLVASAPQSMLPPSKCYVSVACQTEDNPLFPPIWPGYENVTTMISPSAYSSGRALTARPPLNRSFSDKSLVPFPPASSAWLPQEEISIMPDGDYRNVNSRFQTSTNDIPLFMAQGQGRAVNSSPPSSAPKPGSQLDNMLGSLQSDLNKLGVATVAKGVCGACKKPIAGQVVTAMGRTWHPEHFVCTHCQEEIGSRNFFERDGQPYCEKDYHNLFSPRCYYCNGPILDKVVTALDRTWHPEHFFCAQCGAFFGPEGFHERDGKAYCRKDYFDMFAPKCGGCTHAILENYISALNTLWHPECFVCRECFTPFVNGSFFEHDGQPYCEVHYHERRGSLCSGCQKPITGRCITAMGKKFHPEHFVCAFCLKQLNKGTFKEQNDKPYCQNCFVKLFC
ncbi:hypothetical protein GDO81_002126 [Engystomops pustulosus]|nr:hypothetical protein GDO81_002126 [Engystomops pustulosus]